MLRSVALVRTRVLEEHVASTIRVTRFGELGTTVAVTSNRSTLLRNTYYYIVYIAFLRSVLRLLVTANVVASSPIPVILMIEAIRSSETSVITRATQRNIQEDGIFLSHRRENLKSYISHACYAFNSLLRKCNIQYWFTELVSGSNSNNAFHCKYVIALRLAGTMFRRYHERATKV
jgi:hypothetical protein